MSVLHSGQRDQTYRHISSTGEPLHAGVSTVRTPPRRRRALRRAASPHPRTPTGPGRHAVGRQRRRLLHLRRGRPLGRQHERQLSRTPTRSAPTAYYDNAANTAEQINRCHRSKAAEIYIGGGVNGLNLACSGAKTSTYTDCDGNFKPGLDFYNDGAASQGQAQDAAELRRDPQRQDGRRLDRRQRLQLRLDRAALRRPTSSTSPSWWTDYCNDDSLGDGATSPRPTSPRRRPRSRRRIAQRPHGDAQRRLRRRRSTRCSCRTTRRRSRTAPASATRRVRLHAAEHRRLRLLEQRRQLGQRHRAADDQQRRHGAVAPTRPDQRQDARPRRRPSTAAGCARTPSGCSRRRA